VGWGRLLGAFLHEESLGFSEASK